MPQHQSHSTIMDRCHKSHVPAKDTPPPTVDYSTVNAASPKTTTEDVSYPINTHPCWLGLGGRLPLKESCGSGVGWDSLLMFPLRRKTMRKPNPSRPKMRIHHRTLTKIPSRLCH